MKSLELLPWVRIPHRRDVPDTMLCDKVCEWLAASRWFSPGTPVSSTNKTDRHDIAEILLKVALNIITLTPSSDLYLIVCCLLYILYIHENKYTTNNKSCFSKKSQSQTLSHNIVSGTSRLCGIRTHGRSSRDFITILLVSTKWTNASHFKSPNIKKPYHLTLEIQILAWNGQTIVVGLNAFFMWYRANLMISKRQENQKHFLLCTISTNWLLGTHVYLLSNGHVSVSKVST
jgi:hypothetical protein